MRARAHSFYIFISQSHNFFVCSFHVHLCASHHPTNMRSVQLVSRIVSMFHLLLLECFFLLCHRRHRRLSTNIHVCIPLSVSCRCCCWFSSEYKMHVNKCVHSRHEPVHMPEEYYCYYYCADIIHQDSSSSRSCCVCVCAMHVCYNNRAARRIIANEKKEGEPRGKNR